MRVHLVGAHPAEAGRLIEALAPRGVRADLTCCPDDPARLSALFDRVTVVGRQEQCAHFAHELAASPTSIDALSQADLVVWTDDMELFRIAASALPVAQKLRVLPVRTEAGLSLLGSKTGLAAIATDLGLPYPLSAVVRTPEDLPAALATVAAPALVKGERGAGGARVVADPALVDDAWYPVLVQSRIAGPLVGVDALFREGRLAAWAYALDVAPTAPFGPTTARDYLDPPSTDFLEILDTLGAAVGAHGFANSSFIRTASGRHMLIETDLRTNAWHQFGPRLGVDWSAAFRDATASPVHPVIGPGRSRRIHLYPRSLVHAVAGPSFTTLRPWVLASPGTWGTRNHADPALNRAERDGVTRQIARLPRRLAEHFRRNP